MKIEINIPQAAIDDFKESPNWPIKEGETDSQYAKRIVVHMVKKYYEDAKASVVWKDVKAFIKGNKDGIK